MNCAFGSVSELEVRKYGQILNVPIYLFKSRLLYNLSSTLIIEMGLYIATSVLTPLFFNTGAKNTFFPFRRVFTRIK